MATLNYILRGNKDVSTITARFSGGRGRDFMKSIPLNVPRKLWSKKRQRLKGTHPTWSKVNQKLFELEQSIIERYNEAVVEDMHLDQHWFETAIKEHFSNSMKKRQETEIYFVPFAEQVLKKGWKGDDGKVVQSTNHYHQVIKKTAQFEEEVLTHRLKIQDINDTMILDWTNWLLEEKNYSNTYVNRMLKSFSFFLRRAEEDKLKVPPHYRTQRGLMSVKTEDSLAPYLSPYELQKIYELDYEKDSVMDIVRDWLVFGCLSGFRISDYLGDPSAYPTPTKPMDMTNIIERNGDWYIQRVAHKTNMLATVPLFEQNKEILEKRDWNLPPRVQKTTFNKYSKQIAKDAGLDQPVKGKIFQEGEEGKGHRKKVGHYPKWKLISSHICRRSFATIIYDQVGKDELIKMGHWSNDSALRKYLRMTSMESAKNVGAKVKMMNTANLKQKLK